MKLYATYLTLLLFLTDKLCAQLCQGSLGDPIVNISFGSGTNPGAAIPAAATGYQYVGSDCPNDGSYTVRTNSLNCFGNSWHNISSDHTGNANGYLMLVNASIQPSPFYIDTVRGLCGNTTYEFAAWIMNVIQPASCFGNSNQPNLTFEIQSTTGTVLQSYNTNNIPPTASPAWKQYGFFFTTPSTIPDIVLRIKNNAAGGCGNDLALDDITFRPCGPLLTPTIVSQATNTATLCEGTPGIFTFACEVSAGFTNPSFQWQQQFNNGAWIDIPGETSIATTRTFPANAALGNYAFRLAVAESGNMSLPQCRIASAALTISIAANPVTTAGSNSPLCEGNSLALTATGGSSYSWTGPDAFTGTGASILIDQVRSAQSGRYHVLVTNSAGCTHVDSTEVVVNPAPQATAGTSDDTICAGDSTGLSAGGGISYDWKPAAALSSPGGAETNALPTVTTYFLVTVTNSVGCTDTAGVNIIVANPPVANAGPDRAMIEQEPIQLTAAANADYVNFSWNASPYINDIHSLQPIVNPPVETSFIFNVESTAGCGVDSDTMKVFVYKQVFVPSAFSPNSDGMNDTWFMPVLDAFRDFDVSVYNRFGERVFYLHNENKPWDGKFKSRDVPIGVYAYVIDLKRYTAPIKGTVTVLR